MNRTRVLIADDEAAILSVLSYKLSEAGLDVITADDGMEALELARSELPDLLIIDFHMPRQTGLEVCQQLRTDAATAGIRTIMLTACGMNIEPVDLAKAGIDLLMSKPFSPREVLSRVQDLLESGANVPCVGQPCNLK